jgi:hypothetical protein
MNDVRRKEIRRALALIEEAKGIFEVAQTQEQDDFDRMSDDAQDVTVIMFAVGAWINNEWSVLNSALP